MTGHIAAHGRMGGDPKLATTKNDQPMAFATLAVNLPKRGGEEGEEHTEWFSLIAFGNLAQTLAKQKKGDLISVSGVLQFNEYETKSGETRKQFQVLVDSVVSARSVRPGGKLASMAGMTAAAYDREFDDDLDY